MRYFAALAVLLAGCAGWDQIVENASSPEVNDGLGDGVASFLRGDYIGGTVSIVSIAAYIFFRKPVNRRVVAIARGVGQVASAVSRMGKPDQSGGSGGGRGAPVSPDNTAGPQAGA